MKPKNLENLILQIAYADETMWTEEEYDRIVKRRDADDSDSYVDGVDLLQDEIIQMDEDEELLPTLDKLFKMQKTPLDATIMFMVINSKGRLNVKRFTKLKRFTSIPLNAILSAQFNNESDSHRLDTRYSMRDELFYKIVDKFVKPVIKPHLKDPAIHRQMLLDLAAYSDLTFYNYTTSVLFKHGNLTKEFPILFDHFIHFLNLNEELFSPALRSEFDAVIFFNKYVKKEHSNIHLERTYVRPLILSAIKRVPEEKTVGNMRFNSFE